MDINIGSNDLKVNLGTPSSGGTNDHNQLINRDAKNQHPMKAITGLIENGDGSKFLSDNGEYKEITELVINILKEQGLISGNSLTDEEIQALNNMTFSINENGNLIINYNDIVLNLSFSIEDKDLIVNENIDANFSINENGEMEVSY